MAPKFWLKLLRQGVEQMTLSGNLGFVPLDEVLRLLTRAGNDGAVEITGTDITGRIFVAGKGIGLATTLGDHSLRDHLISSGYVSPEELAAIESGHAPMSAFGDSGGKLVGLIREMTVESLYQMETHGSDFEVVKDAASPYAAPVPFDLEMIIQDARQRAVEWDEVNQVISDLGSPMTIYRELEAASVELDRDAWRVLSEIGSGASVQELSGRLGTTDFAIAKVAAGMAQRGLLNLTAQPMPQTAARTVDRPVVAETDYDFEAVADAAVAETPVSNPQESWWEESEAEAAEVESAVAEIAPAEMAAVEPPPVEEAVEPPYDEPPYDEQREPPADVEPPADSEVSSDDETPAAVGEDADAFLEKVFSELGPAEEQESEGHGLMRRRRMGSILRELGED